MNKQCCTCDDSFDYLKVALRCLFLSIPLLFLYPVPEQYPLRLSCPYGRLKSVTKNKKTEHEIEMPEYCRLVLLVISKLIKNKMYPVFI